MKLTADNPEYVDYDEPPLADEPVDPWIETEGRRSTLPWALGGVALLLVGRFVGVRLFEEGAPDTNWLPLLLGGVLPMVLILAYPIIVIRLTGGRVFGRPLSIPTLLMEGAIAIGVLACVYGVNIVTALIYVSASGEQPGMPEQLEELAFSGNPLALAVMGLLACIWAPIAEELFFRRLVLRSFAPHMPIAVAVVTQALIFAILHDYGPMHLTTIFVLGLALGIVYAWRRTIIAPMLVHMLQNTGATAIMGVIMVLTLRAPVLGVSGEKAEVGCLVTLVGEDTAADEAGLEVGDVILTFDGAPVPDFTTLKLLLMLKSAGDEVELKVQRGAEEVTMKVELRERTADSIPAANPDGAGDPSATGDGGSG
jgi:membrane protease YdiL (CAAX protease family)